MSQIAVFGFAFVVFLILVRVFEAEIFGTWVLYQTFMTFAEMARMGFIQNGLVKFLTEDEGNKPHILASATILNLLAGVVLWLIFWGLSYPLSELYESPLLIDLARNYGYIVLTWGGLRLLEYVLMAEQDFKMIFWTHLLHGTTYCSLIVAAMATGTLDSPVMAIWAQSAAAVVAVLIIGLQTKRYVRFGKVKKTLLSKLANYGRYTMGTSLGSMLLQRLDVLMLGFFTGPSGVALYNIGTKLTNYLEIPLRAISIYIFPKLTETYAKQGKHAFAKLYEDTIGKALALIIPPFVLLMLTSEWAIGLMAGPDYVPAAPILRIFLLLSLVKPWGRMAGISLDAIGKPQLNFKLVWISLVLNGGWNLLFIPWLGVSGAAIATVLSMTLTTLMGQFVLKKEIPFQLFAPLTHVLPLYRKLLNTLKSRSFQPSEWL